MEITNWIMIIAVFAGPIVAIRLTRYLDNKKEERERKLLIFKTLMATRAIPLSPQHVEALNKIDLEFNPKIKKEKEVIDAWKAYLDLLNSTTMPVEQWSLKRVDFLVDLLHKMAQVLDYEFDKTTIKNSSYYPRIYGEVEEIQTLLRGWIKQLMENKIAIPMYVVNLPPVNPPIKDEKKENNEEKKPSEA
jgi:hypothetical protein